MRADPAKSHFKMVPFLCVYWHCPAGGARTLGVVTIGDDDGPYYGAWDDALHSWPSCF